MLLHASRRSALAVGAPERSTARARGYIGRRSISRSSIRATRRTATMSASSRSTRWAPTATCRTAAARRRATGVRSGASSRPGRSRASTLLRGPTRPVTRRPVEGRLGWRLRRATCRSTTSSLVGETPQRAAAALRELLVAVRAPDELSPGCTARSKGVRLGAQRARASAAPVQGPDDLRHRRRDRPRARRARVPGHQRVLVRAPCSSASSRATPRSTASPQLSAEDRRSVAR